MLPVLEPSYPARRAADLSECETRGSGVQMGGMRNLIGHHEAADACMLRPAGYACLEQGTVQDQLTAAFEEFEQARPAFGPFEHVILFDGEPRHPPAFGGQGVAGAGDRTSVV